jgi:hypothetical protein
MNGSCRSSDWGMLRTWLGHVALVIESCRTYWVMSHIMTEVCCTSEWVLLHIWMSHVAHVIASCRTCDWVTSHRWISLGAHNDSVMLHVRMSLVAHMNESYVRHMTSHVCDTSQWVTCATYRPYDEVMSHVLIKYGVASVSRIDKIIGLFCKRALSKRRYSAKETYNLSILLTVATPYVALANASYRTYDRCTSV